MRNDKFIKNYLSEMKKVIDDISVEDIDRVIELLYDAWKRGNQVFTCGNGGSASTATHFACDLVKTTGTQDKGDLGLSVSMTTSL